MDFDFEGFLKLFYIYGFAFVVAGFLVGKVMGGINHFRSPATRQQAVALIAIATLVWWASSANGFPFIAIVVGWVIELVAFAIGCLWVLALRQYEERLFFEESPELEPAGYFGYNRTEEQVRRTCRLA